MTLLYCTENHHHADGRVPASSSFLGDRDPLAKECVFLKRALALWRYLDRLRGIAALPSAGAGHNGGSWLVKKMMQHATRINSIGDLGKSILKMIFLSQGGIC